MADIVTRKVLVRDEVQTVYLTPVDPEDLRKKRKEARLQALKDAGAKTVKSRKPEQDEPNRTPKDGKAHA